MADLSVTFQGLKLKNPIQAAAGPAVATPWGVKKAIEAGVGMVVVRTVSIDPGFQLMARPADWFLDKLGEVGTFVHMHTGMPSPEQAPTFVTKVKSLAKREGCKLVGSVMFLGEWTGVPPHPPRPAGERPPEEVVADVAKSLEDAGVDALEIIAECYLTLSQKDTIAFRRESWPRLIKAIKERGLGVPFWIKCGYNHDIFWLDDIKFMEEQGLGAVHQWGDTRSTFINVETGKPVLPVPVTYGRWRRGPDCYSTWVTASNSKLQIISSGGIWNWRDAVERLMCGATLSGVEVAVQYHGHKLFKEIIDGMNNFLDRKGYKKVKDIIGIAVPHIFNMTEFLSMYSQSAVPKNSLKTIVDSTKCIKCEKCAACVFGAVTLLEGIPRINLNMCERCGTCVSICPTDALTIVKA